MPNHPSCRVVECPDCHRGAGLVGHQVSCLECGAVYEFDDDGEVVRGRKLKIGGNA